MFAYLSKNADKKIVDTLKQEGFDIVSLAPFRALCEPTDTHADMLLCSVGDRIFKHGEYEIECSEAEGEKFVGVWEQMGEKYPHDVLLNIAVVGKNAFCNVKHSSATVLEYLKENGIAVHHVEQGYAHCSTCIVSEKAIITADEGIAIATREVGIDALKISAGHISLPPYGYGFIGGASGMCGDKVYFCGSLKLHPDGESIRAFINAHGKEVIELCDAPLSDVGGILFA